MSPILTQPLRRQAEAADPRRGNGSTFGALAPHRNGRNRHRRVLFVTDFYLEDLLAGIVDYAHQAGWELNANMRFHGLFPPATEPCDGILATVTRARVRDWLAARPECPMVRMIGTEFDLPYPGVEADYVAAGRRGARHLLELGHVHFAFYSLYDIPEVREVREGFEAELTAAGQSVRRLDFFAAHPGRPPADMTHPERCHWLAAELRRLPSPLAVMGDDDRRAVELLEACDVAGLRVPEDVAILGCDNHWVEQGMSPVPLSSVDMNFKGVGRRAAMLLDDLMHGQPVSPVTKMPPAGVVARRSTATFVTDSAEITAAIVFLREHFHKPLHIAELARRAGMSERVFQLEFKRRVGHSAREELRRARMARAMQLLRDSDLKLEAIAMETGMTSAVRLCRLFTETHGISPNTWRAQAKAAR
jgi:LacI family transcriptional regulator, galactose operon repressor